MTSGATSILPTVATGAIAAAAFVAVSAAGAVRPQSTMWGPVISRGKSESNSVSLTFDDGPLPGTTDRILDSLGETRVRATFFVIGRFVEKHPRLVERIHNEGHIVANHTFDHSHYGLCGLYRYWQSQIGRTDAAIEQIIGKRPAVFRPPMGFKHWHVINAATDAGQRVVAWSRRARDGKSAPADVIVDRLTSDASSGDIMLMHDGNDPHLKPQDRSGLCNAIVPLIARLRQRGLEPIRLDELLAIPAYQQPEHPSPPRV